MSRKLNNERIIYYSSFNDDVVKNKKQNIKIKEDFKWIHKNLLYKICSKIIYAIAYTFGIFYSKFILHVKVENKETLNKYKNTGYFIYGNHTLPIGDAFNPVRVINKKFYTIASQSNLGTPVIGKLLPMLGALIIPENIGQMKNFIKAVNTRIDEKKAIIIYPEAHVWPYYTKIRNFNETAFKFPVDKNAISFCMTTTYYKRKNKDKPGIKIYIDGPFFPDESLPLKERKRKLSDEIHKTMEKRIKNSTYEYYEYKLQKK